MFINISVYVTFDNRDYKTPIFYIFENMFSPLEVTFVLM